jgi:hypothetical protein
MTQPLMIFPKFRTRVAFAIFVAVAASCNISCGAAQADEVPVVPDRLPIILVTEPINPKAYTSDIKKHPSQFGTNAVLGAMQGMSNLLLRKRALKGHEALTQVLPNLDLRGELATAFGCGEATSNCIELVKSPSDEHGLNIETLANLARQKGWPVAGVLSCWVEIESERFLIHAVFTYVAVDGANTTFAQYKYPLQPKRAASSSKSLAKAFLSLTSASDKASSDASSGAGAAMQSIRASLEEIRKLLFDVRHPTLNSRGSELQLRKIKPQGVECKSHCGEWVSNVTDNRVWLDIPLSMEGGILILETQAYDLDGT